MFGFQSNIRMVVSPLLVVLFATVLLVAVIHFCHGCFGGCHSVLSLLYCWLSVVVFVTVILVAVSRFCHCYIGGCQCFCHGYIVG